MGELTFNHVYGQADTSHTQAAATSPGLLNPPADPAAPENLQQQPAAGAKPTPESSSGKRGPGSAHRDSPRRQSAAADDSSAVQQAAEPSSSQRLQEARKAGLPEQQAESPARTPTAPAPVPSSDRTLRSAGRQQPGSRCAQIACSCGAVQS